MGKPFYEIDIGAKPEGGVVKSEAAAKSQDSKPAESKSEATTAAKPVEKA